MEDSARTEETSDVGEGVAVALEREGTKYLYRRQMAYMCGVDEEQLRNWDRRGELPALRVRDVDPGAARGILDRRIYPCTNEMIEKIKRLDRREGPRQGASAKRAYSRKEAAAALGIHPRTLHNWREQGRVKTIQRGRRVFVPREEVERLRTERRDKSR